MAKLNLKTVLLLIIFLKTVHSKQRIFKFFKADVKAYEPYGNITFFKLKPINRHLAVINAEGYMKQDFKNGLLHIQIFKLDTVDYKPFLVNVTLNACHIISKSITNFYATFLLNEIKRYSNIKFDGGCPFKSVSILISTIM